MSLANYEAAWERHNAEGKKALEEKRYDQAETHFQAAIVIAELLWPREARLGLCLNSLGMVYLAQGKYTEAEPFYQRALTIVEETMGKMVPELLPILEGYAILLRKSRRRPDAEKLERRVEVIKRRQEKEK